MLDKKYNFTFCISKIDEDAICELQFTCCFFISLFQQFFCSRAPATTSFITDSSFKSFHEYCRKDFPWKRVTTGGKLHWVAGPSSFYFPLSCPVWKYLPFRWTLRILKATYFSGSFIDPRAIHDFFARSFCGLGWFHYQVFTFVLNGAQVHPIFHAP